MKLLILSIAIAFIGSAYADCDLEDAFAQTTLSDGSTVWSCGSKCHAEIHHSTQGQLAVLDEGQHGIPGVLNVATGGICPVIFEVHGAGCFDDALINVATSLLPKEGSDVSDLRHTFQNGTEVLLQGQEGNCWQGNYHFTINGLTPQGQTMAKHLRDGEVNQCKWDEFQVRLYMASLWIGFVLGGAVIIAITVVVAMLPSLIVYGLVCGGCKAASSD